MFCVASFNVFSFSLMRIELCIYIYIYIVVYVSACLRVCVCLRVREDPPPPCVSVASCCVCLCLSTYLRLSSCPRTGLCSVLALAPGRNSKVYGGGGTRPQAIKSGLAVQFCPKGRMPRLCLPTDGRCRRPRASSACPAPLVHHHRPGGHWSSSWSKAQNTANMQQIGCCCWFVCLVTCSKTKARW